MADLAETYLPICIGWEGEIRTLYRDSLGFMSVGDGLMLPNLAAALVLPFQVNGVAATADQIAAEWARVQAMPIGLRAEAYAIPGCPSLSILECTDLLRSVVDERIVELTRLLPCFVQVPFSWQLGILDMAYNLGTHGWMMDFPHMVTGIETNNGPVVVAECNRPQLSKARNDWTRAQFAPQ